MNIHVHKYVAVNITLRIPTAFLSDSLFFNCKTDLIISCTIKLYHEAVIGISMNKKQCSNENISQTNIGQEEIRWYNYPGVGNYSICQLWEQIPKTKWPHPPSQKVIEEIESICLLILPHPTLAPALPVVLLSSCPPVVQQVNDLVYTEIRGNSFTAARKH